MKRLLCWLGFHKWIDYSFNFDAWWDSKGVILYCGCGFQKQLGTIRGLGAVRKLINQE